MKNRVVYTIIVSLVIFMSISCSDDDNRTTQNLTGTSWKYKNPHFVFQYAEDTVSIDMGPMGKQSIAVKELNRIFPVIANEKMSAYFKGIEFASASELKIKMQLSDNTSDSLRAAYLNKDGMIEVTLDTADLRRLTGKAMNIPKISFNYTTDHSEMTLYFNKTYVQAISSMMMDQILDMVVPILIEGKPVPPAAIPGIKESLKNQINGIINKTMKLEVGMNMTIDM